MDNKIQRRIRFLETYALISSLLFGLLIFVAAKNPSKKVKFEEIDAERINILEKDGKVRLTISNNERAPGGTVSGVELKSREGKRIGAGLIFFNDEGDECGALVYSGKTVDGKTAALGTIRFDHYRQNEAVGITYGEDGRGRKSGLEVWDQPSIPISAEFGRQFEEIQHTMKDGPEKNEALKKLRTQHQDEFGWTDRVFVGRTPKNEAAVLLMDTKGRPRIRMAVDNSNAASLQFLDENGKVVHSLPTN